MVQKPDLGQLLTMGLLLAVGGPVAAETAAGDAAPVRKTDAIAIEKMPPKYPAQARRAGREGWVIVNYVVGEDGRVKDPVIEDSSGIKAFEKAAVKVVKDWRYKPATYNGVPVEQCHTRHKITFALEGGEPGVTERFMRRYRAVNSALEDNELEQAQQLVTELLERDGLNLYETARAWLLQARVAEARDDDPAALRSYYRAGIANGEWLEPELQAQLLRLLFIKEVGNGDYSAGLQAYEQLATMPDYAPADMETLTEAANEIRAQVRSDSTLGTPALIERHGAGKAAVALWYHSPLRRTIAFSAIDGKPGKFELRCDWRRYQDTVDAERVWRIPASWGRCQVVVFGKEGTRFKLLELPDPPVDEQVSDG